MQQYFKIPSKSSLKWSPDVWNLHNNFNWTRIYSNEIFLWIRGKKTLIMPTNWCSFHFSILPRFRWRWKETGPRGKRKEYLSLEASGAKQNSLGGRRAPDIQTQITHHFRDNLFCLKLKRHFFGGGVVGNKFFFLVQVFLCA